MESYQFEILDQYFSVIVTIPHISIKTQSLCIPTYFSVYLKPQEVIIMHKIHKYLIFENLPLQQMTASVTSYDNGGYP